MRAQRLRPFGIVFIILFGLYLLSAQPAHAADPAPRGWTDTGITLDNSIRVREPNGYSATFCFDTYDPNIAYYSTEDDIGDLNQKTRVINWRTGQTNTIPYTFLTNCGELGTLFSNIRNSYFRFSRTNLQLERIEHIPFYVVPDGSGLMYSSSSCDGTGSDPFCLFVSTDNGTTWQKRLAPALDARKSIQPNPQHVIFMISSIIADASSYTYTLYGSDDGGVTWEKRFTGSHQGSDHSIVNLRTLAPTNLLELRADYGIGSHQAPTDLYLSNDEGRTFFSAGTTGGRSFVNYYGISGGLIAAYGSAPDSLGQFTYTYTISHDNGRTWNPYNLPTLPCLGCLTYAPAAPANLFIYRASPTLWYSSNNGDSWQDIAASPEQLFVNPYLPLTVLGVFGNHLYSLDLPNAGKSQTKPAPVKSTPGSMYFPQTQHTMSQLFSQYWTDHGGLAQFGYPKTEAFRELNSADNHIYVVQYFERARFEYHLEAPQEYRVLLGLLGNQLTVARMAAGEGAFNRFPNMNYPGGTYFPQTGHNLRNDFKKYWEARGGLAIYGYPTSEEFYEVNPDDGKTYVVQYFERNRFEYHPENTDTPYVVLLGLLGNQVLRNKGWL